MNYYHPVKEGKRTSAIRKLKALKLALERNTLSQEIDKSLVEKKIEELEIKVKKFDLEFNKVKPEITKLLDNLEVIKDNIQKIENKLDNDDLEITEKYNLNKNRNVFKERQKVFERSICEKIPTMHDLYYLEEKSISIASFNNNRKLEIKSNK